MPAIATAITVASSVRLSHFTPC